MGASLRTFARVLAGLVLLCAAFALSVVVKVRAPVFSSGDSAASGGAAELARARESCDEHAHAAALDRWARGDAGLTLQQACERLPTSAEDESDPALLAVSRAHAAMRALAEGRRLVAVMFVVGLGIAACFAVFGWGRVAALLTVLAVVLPCVRGMFESVPVALVAALVFLGASPAVGDSRRAPRESTLAALVAALLAPPGALAMILAGSAKISVDLEARLAFTTKVAAVVWILVGAPLTVLLRRARREAKLDPGLAAPRRVGFARLVLIGLSIATAVAYAAAIRHP